jgi:hypothetical protein
VTAAWGFDEGLAVGLLSSGMTQSAALGTGVSAIAELPFRMISREAHRGTVGRCHRTDSATSA